MCKRLKMLFLPTFPSIKRQRTGSISFSNTHHIRLLLPKLTIWWGNTKMIYVPTTYQISPLSCHYYASSYYLCTTSSILQDIDRNWVGWEVLVVWEIFCFHDCFAFTADWKHLSSILLIGILSHFQTHYSVADLCQGDYYYRNSISTLLLQNQDHLLWLISVI